MKFRTSMVALAIAVGFFVAVPNDAIAVEKRVMVFGDSNSWGWIPVENILPTSRYPKDVRWPGVAANKLGGGYVVINESLSARTAATSDDTLGVSGAGLNGLEYLPAALATHFPLDLVVIMLGTNDTKPYLGQSTLDIGLDVMQLVSEVRKSTGVATQYSPAKVLVVSPPPLGTIADVAWLQAVFPAESVKKSKELSEVLSQLSIAVDVAFFDAGSVAVIDGFDGVHMTAENHTKLGLSIAGEISALLQD